MNSKRNERLFFPEDWLFVVGVNLMTMTKLRFGEAPIGPGEITILLWIMIKVIFRKRCKHKIHRINLISKYFWIILIITLSIGALLNILFFQYHIGYHNVLSYLFCFTIVIVLCNYASAEMVCIYINRIVFVGTIIFGVVYILSSLGPLYTFAHANSYRFTGGANNPNQLAALICAFPPVALMNCRKKVLERSVICSVGWILIALISVFVGRTIYSDALNAAWLIAIPAYIYARLTQFPGSNGRVIRIVALILFLLIVIFNNEWIGARVLAWFNGIDEGGSRAFYWGTAFKIVLRSGFLGLGPGSFAGYYYLAEAHNTLIDFMMQGGIVLTGYVGFLLIYLFLRLENNPFFFSAYVSMLLVCMGHFFGRQPVFYLYLTYFFALSEKVETFPYSKQTVL